jgi:hypothetical protein
MVLKVVELMPETKAKRRPAAKTATKKTATKKTAAKRRPATKRPAAAGKRDANGAVDRTTQLSEDMLESLDEGARAAIAALRKFVETVDRVLPPQGDGPSRREEITDSALEMSQRLVHTQYEFLRKVVDSAGKTLTKTDGAR